MWRASSGLAAWLDHLTVVGPKAYAGKAAPVLPASNSSAAAHA
jgi:hypothetical protein